MWLIHAQSLVCLSRPRVARINHLEAPRPSPRHRADQRSIDRGIVFKLLII